MGVYSAQVSAIKDILTDSPILNVKKVYEGDFEAIPVYPAISVNLKGRVKTVKGIGGVKETVCTFELWVYSNKPNYSSALQELEDLTEQIEETVKNNRTLGNLVSEANVDSNAEFGVTDRGGTFLQTALLQLTTKKLGV
jgi:hypothetical protein